MTLKTKSTLAPDFLKSVNQVVIGLLPYNPTIEKVSHAMGCSVRTLQRRLEESDEEFSTLLAKIRHLTACRLLENSDVRLIDIAQKLGYSSASAFSRAFQQWQGISATDYRKSVLTERQPDGSSVNHLSGMN